jgi:hypothetical protein
MILLLEKKPLPLLAKLRRDGIDSVESNQSYENFQ